MRTYCLLLLCWLSISVSAQSRWQASLGTCLSLAGNRNAEKISSRGRLDALGLHYRVARWLDLGAEVGHRRSIVDGRRESGGLYLGEIAVSFDYRTIRTEWFAGLAPRVNYRVGQGDLSATLGFGVASHRLQMDIPHGSDPGGTAEVKFARFSAPYTDLRLGYTYWFHKRIGLYGGLQYRNSQVSRTVSGATGRNNAGFYTVESVDGATTPTSRQAGWGLQEPVRKQANLYLRLGSTIRL